MPEFLRTGNPGVTAQSIVLASVAVVLVLFASEAGFNPGAPRGCIQHDPRAGRVDPISGAAARAAER